MNKEKYRNLTKDQQKKISRLYKFVDSNVHLEADPRTTGVIEDVKINVQWEAVRTSIKYELLIKWDVGSKKEWEPPKGVVTANGKRIR